jgi:hypothetical protein
LAALIPALYHLGGAQWRIRSRVSAFEEFCETGHRSASTLASHGKVGFLPGLMSEAHSTFDGGLCSSSPLMLPNGPSDNGLNTGLATSDDGLESNVPDAWKERVLPLALLLRVLALELSSFDLLTLFLFDFLTHLFLVSSFWHIASSFALQF